MGSSAQPPLAGVFPVLATPFQPDGSPDEDGLRAIARYVIGAGADGVVFPGVASEFETLSPAERNSLADVVALEAQGKVAFVLGGSAADPADSEAIARRARVQGAGAIMVMAPKSITERDAVVAFFRRVAEAAGPVPIMLQNAPPPAGSGLAVDV